MHTKKEKKNLLGKKTHAMTEKNPVTVFLSTLFCLGGACLITGIVFLSNPQHSGTDPEYAIYVGKILPAIGGTIVGLQLLVLCCFCCIYNTALGVAIKNEA
jgi:Ni,Fe-hydrogenase I cytochrome b subunit